MSVDFAPQPSSLLFALCAILASVYAIRTIRYNAAHKLPPGPKGLPFFGNLFQLSTTPWKEFDIWRKQYDSLMYITAGGQGILVLNSHKVATELLDRRVNIYSDRPRMIMANELFTNGLVLPMMTYGESWRRMRRAGHEVLSEMLRGAEFHPILSKEAILLTDGLLQNSAGWDGELRRASASSMLCIVYDIPTVLSATDPIVTNINKFMDAATKYAIPGNFLVEFIPWMLYIPSSLAKWKREAKEGFHFFSELFTGMFRDVETRISQGDERPSIAGSLIREPRRNRLSDSEAAWLSAMMYGGGSDTTAAVMTWFMLAMIAYPEKQRKCQEELEHVIGRSRMPTLEDQNSLPYIRATVRELLRWRPVGPIAMPHNSAEDDWYEGYFIPKGTTVIANIWSLNRDRAVYGEDADDFNPDRFIDERGQLTAPLADTRNGHLTFGFGPRICLGRHIATTSLFIDIASILWAVNIDPVKDEAGKPIIPDTLETLNAGLVIRPLPFDCVITPRFPEAKGIVAQTRELL